MIPATVEFVDIAGIVKGASEGEGLGNKFLSHIRESAAICQVTRVFRDEDVTHVDGEVNPANDISTIQTEMILADLQTVEKAIPRLEKEAKGKKELAPVVAAAKEALAALEAGTPIIATDIDRPLIRELSLLTAKPYIYVFNCDADELADEDLKKRMRDLVAPAEAIFLDAKFEAELVELDDEDEAREMLAEMGVDEPGLDVLARVGFDTLGLQTYLTAGPKESRAWTIQKGATAPEAAGVIHTDFQRGFIKAEIVSFDDLVEAGLHGRRQGRGQGAHGGQGLRDGGRRRGGVPLQRVNLQVRGLVGGPPVRRESAEFPSTSSTRIAAARLVRSSADGHRVDESPAWWSLYGVPECPLHGDHVAAGSDEPGGEEVPKVVETERRDSGPGDRRPPPVADRVLMRRGIFDPGEEPLVAMWKLEVPGDDLHQLVRDRDGPLGAVLGQADIHPPPSTRCT